MVAGFQMVSKSQQLLQTMMIFNIYYRQDENFTGKQNKRMLSHRFSLGLVNFGLQVPCILRSLYSYSSHL
jgi:hypothetical protein